MTDPLLQDLYRRTSSPPGQETANLTGEATQRIRQLILDGELEPDTRINEVHLCETLSISRTPLRAALQTLAGEGLLVYVANRGFTVRAYKLSEIIDAYEMRRFAEGLAARLAAERGIGAVELETMQHALECGDRLIEDDISPSVRQDAYATINGMFHGAIHRAAGTQLLVDVLGICRIPQVSARKIMPLTLEEIGSRQGMHHKIFRAILCREAQTAEALMQAHVGDVKAAMVLALNRNQTAMPAPFVARVETG